MTKPVPTDPSAALAALADDYASKTKAAIFRAQFDGIERALKSGAPRSRVIEILNAHGITLSAAAFNEYLYRERNRRRKAALTHHPSPATLAPSARPLPEDETVDNQNGFNRSDPRSIDAIINSTPDLESLAKIHLAQTKKGSA